MPHCIIEYADAIEESISPHSLMNAVFNGALRSELFSANDIKVRVMPFSYFTSGNEKKSFVHVSVKILSGRTLAQRKHLSELVLASLNDLFVSSISLTVEIIEIERESYSKLVI